MVSMEICQRSYVSDKQEMWVWAAERKLHGSHGTELVIKLGWDLDRLDRDKARRTCHLQGGIFWEWQLAHQPLSWHQSFQPRAACCISVYLPSLGFERPRCSSLTWWEGQAERDQARVSVGCGLKEGEQWNSHISDREADIIEEVEQNWKR